ncbi:MAG: hypothetical protein ACRDID_17490 [Ktedonobacterales bacterium]
MRYNTLKDRYRRRRAVMAAQEARTTLLRRLQRTPMAVDATPDDWIVSARGAGLAPARGYIA